MSRQFTPNDLTALPLSSQSVRDRRHALARELADYSSDADRNDLQVLVDASISSAAWEVGEILDRQAHARLHQSN